MFICGRVLKVERVQGSSEGRSWDYWQVFVLDGVEVFRCRVGSNWRGDLPKEGFEGCWRVQVRAYVKAQNYADLAYSLESPVNVSELKASRAV